MMGPDPINKILWMSVLFGIVRLSWLVARGSWLVNYFESQGTSDESLLGFIHHLNKIPKQILRVMRARRGLRMVLKT